jgi:hypothetical protein
VCSFRLVISLPFDPLSRGYWRTLMKQERSGQLRDGMWNGIPGRHLRRTFRKLTNAYWAVRDA